MASKCLEVSPSFRQIYCCTQSKLNCSIYTWETQAHGQSRREETWFAFVVLFLLSLTQAWLEFWWSLLKHKPSSVTNCLKWIFKFHSNFLIQNSQTMWIFDRVSVQLWKRQSWQHWKTILQVQSSLVGLKYMGVIAVGVHASQIEKRNP